MANPYRKDIRDTERLQLGMRSPRPTVDVNGTLAGPRRVVGPGTTQVPSAPSREDPSMSGAANLGRTGMLGRIAAAAAARRAVPEQSVKGPMARVRAAAQAATNAGTQPAMPWKKSAEALDDIGE